MQTILREPCIDGKIFGPAALYSEPKRWKENDFPVARTFRGIRHRFRFALDYKIIGPSGS
jgi:hypothetical protein